jgi:hypothetical protein
MLVWSTAETNGMGEALKGRSLAFFLGLGNMTGFV